MDKGGGTLSGCSVTLGVTPKLKLVVYKAPHVDLTPHTPFNVFLNTKFIPTIISLFNTETSLMCLVMS